MADRPPPWRGCVALAASVRTCRCFANDETETRCASKVRTLMEGTATANQGARRRTSRPYMAQVWALLATWEARIVKCRCHQLPPRIGEVGWERHLFTVSMPPFRRTRKREFGD